MTILNELQGVLGSYVSAYRKGDAHGCAAVFTSDALLISPFGPAARGRDEIKAMHEGWTGEGGEDKHMEIVEFGGTNGLAWCLARFSEESAGEGTSLNVFERQPNGAWLIRICSLNET
jgi:ketosteroid isomerase-like protein